MTDRTLPATLAIGYASHYGRPQDAVIRVYDATGNGIETDEHVILAGRIVSKRIETNPEERPPWGFTASRGPGRWSAHSCAELHCFAAKILKTVEETVKRSLSRARVRVTRAISASESASAANTVADLGSTTK